MARNVIPCHGCKEGIELVPVGPSEDDTVAFRVVLPARHTYIRVVHGVTYIGCWNGAEMAIAVPDKVPPATMRYDSEAVTVEELLGPAARDSGESVEHETWMEYHDRLIREYYDVEAEWALIKEICPELDRPEPVAKPVRARRRLPPYHGVAAGFGMTAAMNLMIGATWVAIIWFTLTLAMLTVANMHTRR